MAQGWRPTADQRDAIRRALRLLNSRQQVPGWVVQDDLTQAALVALWQAPEQSQEPAHLLQFCRSRMLDELRRQLGRGVDKYQPWGAADASDRAHFDTPEQIAIAHDAVRAISRMCADLQQALDCALQPEPLNTQALQHGISPELLNYRLRRAERVMLAG